MAETTTANPRLAWTMAAFVLILSGCSISAYLLIQHFGIHSGEGKLFDVCQAVFGGGCDDALNSDLSVQLGIPLGGWGLVHFTVVATTLVLALCLGDSFRGAGALTGLVLCITATVLGAVLTGLMFAQGSICPLCLTVHVINLLLIPAIPLACGLTVGQLRRSLAAGWQYLGNNDDGDPIVARWQVTGLVLLALVGIVMYQWVLIQTDRHIATDEKPWTFERVLAEYRAEPVQEIALSDNDPRLGEGPLQLVIFSDFECPACRRFAEMVSHAREHHPELEVVFKHYPLSKTCNPRIRVNLHPLSCAAALAAEAARRQGKFWEYHDALFASDEPLEDEVLRQTAESIGMDMARFDAERNSPDVQTKLEEDCALGKDLSILGTPSAFLDGKRLDDHALGRLEELIDHELSSSSQAAASLH